MDPRTASQNANPNVNEVSEKLSLFRQIKQLRETTSRQTKIIILLILLMIVGGAGAASFYYYERYYSNSVKRLTLDITEDIVRQPESSRNRVERRLIDDELVNTYTPAQIDRISSTLYPAYSNQQALYGADEYTIHYFSTDEDNKPLKIKAQVFVPRGEPGQKFPLFVFGQGTTGIGDQCAPSMERPSVSNWGNYYNHLRTYAGQGFITVFPDYEGFNDPDRIHHYFNALLEAHVLLDGTRATFELFPDKSEPAVFYGGYSQGGHAAFAVKDLHTEYAPDVPIKGVIGFGATTNIVNMLKENPDLGPYLLYSYADFYGKDKVRIEELIQPAWLPTFEQDVLGKCISAVPSYYGTDPGRVYTPKFVQALQSKNFDEFPGLGEIFNENSTGLKPSTLPSLLIQGDPDPIVTVRSQEEFVRQACGIGSNITYNKYHGVHHFQTRHVSFKDVSNWMRDILGGRQPGSVCENLGELSSEGIQTTGTQAPADSGSQEDIPVVAPPGDSGAG